MSEDYIKQVLHLIIQESGGKETDKEDVAATVHSAEKTEKEAEEGEKTEEKEESMEVGETAAELDTIELTSNEFENDLLGAAVPAVKEDTTEGRFSISPEKLLNLKDLKDSLT